MRWWLVVSILASLISVLTGHLNLRVHSKQLDQLMRDYMIVPQVIPESPDSVLFVYFPSGNYVEPTNFIPGMDTDRAPELEYYYDERWFYTVVMIDPDMPTSGHRVRRERIHWLVGNFKGKNHTAGETIVEYMGANPQIDSGYHRYVILVYEHLSKRDYLEPFINKTTLKGRDRFSIKRFHEMYCLNNLIAGTFFRSSYDPWQGFNFSKYINISNY